MSFIQEKDCNWAEVQRYVTDTPQFQMLVHLSGYAAAVHFEYTFIFRSFDSKQVSSFSTSAQGDFVMFYHYFKGRKKDFECHVCWHTPITASSMRLDEEGEA